MKNFSQRIDTAFTPVRQAIDAGRIPGAVFGITDANGNTQIRHYGAAQTVPTSRPMKPDTWFDLASLTKVIYTTPAILALVDQGVIALDDPLTKLLPDLRQYNPLAWERKVTFRQALGHQSPFPAVEPIYTYGSDPNLLRAFILQREFRAGPPVYSDFNFMLLGFALERHYKTTLRNLPAGEGFGWSAPAELSAATEDCTWRNRVLSGEVHDDNCSALQGAGHAGLFGTASSVLNYARSLLDGSGASQAAITSMRTALSATRTHGWERPYAGWHGGDNCSQSTIGHTGFTGTSLCIDFENQIAWTLLTNRIHPTRHFDSGIIELRRAVSNSLFRE